MGHALFAPAPALAVAIALAFATIVNAESSLLAQPGDSDVTLQVKMAALTLDSIEDLKDHIVVLHEAELAIEMVNVDAELLNMSSFGQIRLTPAESGIDELVDETNAAIEALTAELEAMPTDVVEAARQLPVPEWRIEKIRERNCAILALYDESSDFCPASTN